MLIFHKSMKIAYLLAVINAQAIKEEKTPKTDGQKICQVGCSVGFYGVIWFETGQFFLISIVFKYVSKHAFHFRPKI